MIALATRLYSWKLACTGSLWTLACWNTLLEATTYICSNLWTAPCSTISRSPDRLIAKDGRYSTDPWSFFAGCSEREIIFDYDNSYSDGSITGPKGMQSIVCTNGIAYRPHFLYSQSRPMYPIVAFLKRSGNWTRERGAIVSFHPRLKQRNHNPSLLFLVFPPSSSFLTPVTFASFVPRFLLSPYNAKVLGVFYQRHSIYRRQWRIWIVSIRDVLETAGGSFYLDLKELLSMLEHSSPLFSPKILEFETCLACLIFSAIFRSVLFEIIKINKFQKIVSMKIDEIIESECL